MTKLIKIGHKWVNPERVEIIDIHSPPEGLRISANDSEEKSLPDGRNNHYVALRMFDSWITVAYFDSMRESKDFADKYAAIINEAKL